MHTIEQWGPTFQAVTNWWQDRKRREEKYNRLCADWDKRVIGASIAVFEQLGDPQKQDAWMGWMAVKNFFKAEGDPQQFLQVAKARQKVRWVGTYPPQLNEKSQALITLADLETSLVVKTINGRQVVMPVFLRYPVFDFLFCPDGADNFGFSALRDLACRLQNAGQGSNINVFVPFEHNKSEPVNCLKVHTTQTTAGGNIRKVNQFFAFSGLDLSFPDQGITCHTFVAKRKKDIVYSPSSMYVRS